MATAISFAVGLYFALIASPPDYQQGETVRIMHIHVSAAWIAMFAYAWVGLASAAALIWRHPFLAARTICPDFFLDGSAARTSQSIRPYKLSI